MTPPVGRTKRSTRSDKSNESSENTPSKTPKADEEDQTQERFVLHNVFYYCKSLMEDALEILYLLRLSVCSVSAVTTVKVSRTPLVIQGSKPKTIQGVQRTQEHINEAMNRSKRKTTGENEGKIFPKSCLSFHKSAPARFATFLGQAPGRHCGVTCRHCRGRGGITLSRDKGVQPLP